MQTIIYHPHSDQPLCTIPNIMEGSVEKRTLMQDDYIELHFTLAEAIHFPVGAYTTWGGREFLVTEIQNPTYDTETGGWRYELKLEAYYLAWRNVILKYYPEDTALARETSFVLTDKLADTAGVRSHIAALLRALSREGLTYNGTPITAAVGVAGAEFLDEAKTIAYENISILDAITSIADTFETEWWVEGAVLHFGKCQDNTASIVDLRQGDNVETIDGSKSDQDYATRVFVYGGTNNMPANSGMGEPVFEVSETKTFILYDAQEEMTRYTGTSFVFNNPLDKDYFNKTDEDEDVYTYPDTTFTPNMLEKGTRDNKTECFGKEEKDGYVRCKNGGEEVQLYGFEHSDGATAIARSGTYGAANVKASGKVKITFTEHQRDAEEVGGELNTSKSEVRAYLVANAHTKVSESKRGDRYIVSEIARSETPIAAKWTLKDKDTHTYEVELDISQASAPDFYREAQTNICYSVAFTFIMYGGWRDTIRGTYDLAIDSADPIKVVFTPNKDVRKFYHARLQQCEQNAEGVYVPTSETIYDAHFYPYFTEENETIKPVGLKKGLVIYKDKYTTYKVAVGQHFLIKNIIRSKLPSSYFDESTIKRDTTLNAITENRLSLPGGIDYIDMEHTEEPAYDWQRREIVEKVLVFDDIYPRTESEIKDVQLITRLQKTTDTNGEEIDEPFTAYYIRAFTPTEDPTGEHGSITFDNDYKQYDTQLQVKFQTGALAGLTFDVLFDPTDKDNETTRASGQYFYIKYTEVADGFWLPNKNMRPKSLADYQAEGDTTHTEGDKFILIGWDASRIEDLGLVASAQQELLTEAKKEIAEMSIDPNTYEVTMMSDRTYGINPDGEPDPSYAQVYDIGRRVRLYSDALFRSDDIILVDQNGNELTATYGSTLIAAKGTDGYRESRIMGYERKMDLPYDSEVYTIGEKATYSRFGSLEKKISGISVGTSSVIALNIGTGTGGTSSSTTGSGASVNIITTTDTTAEADTNVLSALRAKNDFLSRKNDDEAFGHITFSRALTAAASAYDEASETAADGIIENYMLI